MTATRGSGSRDLARQSRRAGSAVDNDRVRSKCSYGAFRAKQNLADVLREANDEEQHVRASCHRACVCQELSALCYQRLCPRWRARVHRSRIACID